MASTDATTDGETAARDRLEALALAVLGDAGVGSVVYSYLHYVDLNEARLTCRPVRDALAAAPLCPSAVEGSRPVRGPTALRRFRAAYPAARSLDLRDARVQVGTRYGIVFEVSEPVTDADLARYATGLHELCCAGLAGITGDGIAAIASSIRDLRIACCPEVAAATLRCLGGAKQWCAAFAFA